MFSDRPNLRMCYCSLTRGEFDMLWWDIFLNSFVSPEGCDIGDWEGRWEESQAQRRPREWVVGKGYGTSRSDWAAPSLITSSFTFDDFMDISGTTHPNSASDSHLCETPHPIYPSGSMYSDNPKLFHSSKWTWEHWMALIFCMSSFRPIPLSHCKEGLTECPGCTISTCTFATSSVDGREVPQMGVSFMMHIFMTGRSQMASTT